MASVSDYHLLLLQMMMMGRSDQGDLNPLVTFGNPIKDDIWMGNKIKTKWDGELMVTLQEEEGELVDRAKELDDDDV